MAEWVLYGMMGIPLICGVLALKRAIQKFLILSATPKMIAMITSSSPLPIQPA